MRKNYAVIPNVTLQIIEEPNNPDYKLSVAIHLPNVKFTWFTIEEYGSKPIYHEGNSSPMWENTFKNVENLQDLLRRISNSYNTHGKLSFFQKLLLNVFFR